VHAWYKEVKARAAAGEDPSQVLLANLAADIEQEVKRTNARRRSSGGDAASRLYKDAQRRAHKAASVGDASSPDGLVQYASAMSMEDRSAVSARNQKLLADMESKKQAEVRHGRCQTAPGWPPPARVCAHLTQPLPGLPLTLTSTAVALAAYLEGVRIIDIFIYID